MPCVRGRLAPAPQAAHSPPFLHESGDLTVQLIFAGPTLVLRDGGSFAVPTMQGEIRSLLPRSHLERTSAARAAGARDPRRARARAVHQRRRAQPTAGELAERIGCTIEEIIDALEAAHARGSDPLDRPLSSDDDDGGVTLGKRLGGEDPRFAAAEATADVDRLLDTLPERDALVVRLRFHEDLTQADIGKRIGCSQMHVSRILRAALEQLANRAATPAAVSGRQPKLVLD